MISVIDRPSGTDQETFIALMEDVLEKVKSENKIFYLLGDYYTNVFNFDKHTLTLNCVDLFHSHSFVSLIY